jgi:hypothetical protein
LGSLHAREHALARRLEDARDQDDVDTSNTLAYVFVAGVAVLFVSLLALEWYMLGHTPRARD